MKQETVIFNATNPESLKKKFKHKEKNPKAIFVKSSDKDALKQALKGNVENVVNYDDNLDLRKLKGDNVVEGKAPVKKEKTPVENKTPKKEAPKKKKK